MTNKDPHKKISISGLKAGIQHWISHDFIGLFREFRWSYLPPLMVYFAAGVSGFTGIIESFFVKEELGLSAASNDASKTMSAISGRNFSSRIAVAIQ